jgi:hypothetical protein
MRINKLIPILLLAITLSAQAQQKKYKVHTVAFYNLENLFDTIRNTEINDLEYTPEGKNSWTSKKYKKKLENLSRVISEIGTGDQQKESPTILGVSEVENRGVLEDLIKTPKLVNLGYGIVHFDSPDRRGIDVALLYKKKDYIVNSTSSIPLYIYDGNGKRVYTRDQLLVSGYLDGEEMHFIVNHWPSRSGGEKRSSPYREAAGALNKKIIDSLLTINPKAKVMTMGDLNDGPYNKSVKVALGAERKKENTKPSGMFNPFEEMSKKGLGTLAYRDAWDLFDQIIMTGNFLDTNDKDYSTYKYWKAGIYQKPYMVQQTGQYKGYPLRNANNEVGFSDHFPVYVYIIKEVN